MKKFILTFAYTLCILSTLAEDFTANTYIGNNDSLHLYKTRNLGHKLDKFSSSRLYQMTYIGVPLVVGGLIVKSEDDHFRSLRNDYLPQFSRHADDYLQYAPAIVMLGMKSFGVKGRSSWG